MNPRTQEKVDNAGNVLASLIDPRVPLPWVIAVIVVAAGAYFQLQAVKEAVTDLQITVRAGNQSYSALASEQALLKFRQSNTEEDIKNLRAAMAANMERVRK